MDWTMAFGEWEIRRYASEKSYFAIRIGLSGNLLRSATTKWMVLGRHHPYIISVYAFMSILSLIDTPFAEQE